MLASWLARQPRTQRDEPGPSLATVRDAASAFATGVDSMALRVLLVTRAPCAVVTIAGGRVAWWAHGDGFAPRVGWGHRLDERTVAARLRAGEAGGPELVAREAWDVGARARRSSRRRSPWGIGGW